MHEITIYLGLFIGSFGITSIITPLLRVFSLKYKIFLDYPGERKIHKNPTPRIGGVALYLSITIAILSGFILNPVFAKNFNKPIIGLLLGSTIILFGGLYDDLKGLNAKKKFIIQLSAAVVAVLFEIKITAFTNPFGSGPAKLYLGFLDIPITLLWIIGLTNAINLIDGLDGLAAGLTFIISLTLFLIALFQQEYFIAFLYIPIVGASIGFLGYNLHPALIFLGDSGSMFLGYILSAIAIIGSQKSTTAAALLMPIIAMGIPIADTFFAIIRRLQKKQNVFQADTGHLHHKLLTFGLHQKTAVVIIYAICIILGAIAFIFTRLHNELAGILIIIISIIIIVVGGRIGLIRIAKHKSDPGDLD